MKTLSKLCIFVGFMISLFLVTHYYDEIGWLSYVLGVGSFFIFILLSYVLAGGKNLEDSPHSNAMYSKSHPLRLSSDIGSIIGESANELFKQVDMQRIGDTSPVMIKLELIALYYYSVSTVATDLLGNTLQKEIIISSFIDTLGMGESMVQICLSREKEYNKVKMHNQNGEEPYQYYIGEKFIANCGVDIDSDEENVYYAGELFSKINISFGEIIVDNIKQLQKLAGKYNC